MRLTDLLLFPVAALWQQKSRTVLTTLGVVFGAFVLTASLAINHGVQAMIARESSKTDVLRRIDVHVRWDNRSKPGADAEIVVQGKMSNEKRRRIRAALAQQQNQMREPAPSALLTPVTLKRLAALEHVQQVEPGIWIHDFVHLKGQPQQVQVGSARPHDPVYLRRTVAGRFLQAPDEPAAVVSEFLLYRCGIIDDDAVAAVLGEKLKIEIHSWHRPEQASLRMYLSGPGGHQSTHAEVDLIARLNKQIPKLIAKLDLTASEKRILRPALENQLVKSEDEPVITGEFTIVGVIRQVTEEELSERRWWDDLGGSSDVFLPYQTATDFYFRSPTNRSTGPHQALLIADNVDHVKEIARQVNDMGLQAYAAIEFIERERLIWRLVLGGMSCIAAVALLVAAMGIANTMLMSVLERTREIGIMKAVGASGTHIQTIFLIEGSLIGAAGGVLGLLLAWLASLPGDAWVRGMVERDMNVKLRDALFVFPSWLVLTVILFSTLVTTAAAFYPARRAARVDPVTALRHE